MWVLWVFISDNVLIFLDGCFDIHPLDSTKWPLYFALVRLGLVTFRECDSNMLFGKYFYWANIFIGHYSPCVFPHLKYSFEVQGWNCFCFRKKLKSSAGGWAMTPHCRILVISTLDSRCLAIGKVCRLQLDIDIQLDLFNILFAVYIDCLLCQLEAKT